MVEGLPGREESLAGSAELHPLHPRQLCSPTLSGQSPQSPPLPQLRALLLSPEVQELRDSPSCTGPCSCGAQVAHLQEHRWPGGTLRGWRVGCMLSRPLMRAFE